MLKFWILGDHYRREAPHHGCNDAEQNREHRVFYASTTSHVKSTNLPLITHNAVPAVGGALYYTVLARPVTAHAVIRPTYQVGMKYRLGG